MPDMAMLELKIRVVFVTEAGRAESKKRGRGTLGAAVLTEGSALHRVSTDVDIPAVVESESSKSCQSAERAHSVRASPVAPPLP